jgi:quinol monooxygenase YgiN
MYGTVARMRVKPGMESQLRAMMSEYDTLAIPGMNTTYLYRMDDDPNTFFMAVVFESREAYRKNAESPEQDARYQAMVALMEGPPEWHDGEIVYP